MARFIPVALAGLALSLLATDARAAGSFKLKSNQMQEVSGAWHVFVTIELPKAPSVPHVPIKFVFTKIAVYERALVDNTKEPVFNRIAVQGPMPSVESLDVDFADPRGMIWPKTHFEFGLTRTRGYEAGEYRVQLRTADGIEIGTPAPLILKGDNPVVDRRSIAFNAKDSSIKKIDTGVDAGTDLRRSDPAESSGPPPSSVEPAGSAPPFIPLGAYTKTPEEEIKERPKGCGCSVPGDGHAASSLVVSALAGASVLMAMRRRNAR